MVVRRLVRGQTGPSGGPAMTDLLGVMESWADGVTTVRGESGAVTSIDIADIVTGKPVPPRPSVRHRISAEDAERRANAAWPALVTEPLGDWLLRASGGYSSRANSVMAVGDPGVAFSEAEQAVLAFYERHRLPAWAQVVVGSEAHHAFDSAGWLPARPDEADSLFQIASVSMASRAVRRSLPAVVPAVSLSTTADSAWLADDSRARAQLPTAIGVLEGPDEVAFASVRASIGAAQLNAPVNPPVIAKGRAAYSDDWVGITDIEVARSHRRQGLAVAVMGALLGWGAERGATTAYLQTRGDNGAALALYERLDFRTHHTYRYLRR